MCKRDEVSRHTSFSPRSRIRNHACKFYEYLAAEKPIFCITNEGPTKKYIKEYGLGQLSSDLNIKTIANNLDNLIKRIQNNQFIYPDIKELKDKISNIKNESINETFEFGQDLNALLRGIEEDLANREKEIEENLRAWFGKGKKGGAGGGGWDRYNTKGERIGKCGDSKKGEGKPKCLSKSRAASLRAKGGKAAIGAAVRRKRREDPNKNRKGKAKNVSNTTRKKKKK